MTSVSVMGGGAWGTALAMVAERAGSKTTLWVKDKALALNMQHERVNTNHLAEVLIEPSIQITAQLSEVSQANIMVVAVPAQTLREVLKRFKPYLKPDTYIILASKGIEAGSGLLMSEVAREVISDNVLAILSGPNFADEVARNLPSATTLATEDPTIGTWLAHSFSSLNFRVYTSQDIIGAQIAGALKNVLAIAAGILEGRNMGANAQAALITRGLAEITRLVVAKGGKPETMLGLTGVGDLCLTCTSEKSRNMKFGKSLGLGMSVEDVCANSSKVIEGIPTAKSIVQLADALHVDVPICRAIHGILYQGLDVDTAIAQLLSRPLKPEFID
ncbi:MAG: NAD(P)-dependent glycerol-3-phosphate dehydrogenase [Alphaproteobacteria bacterium]|nr:NAD(P)-dependent glycerol-3-phosphate dehydrogenase [Alphaproteobacteria bacterium]